MFIYDFFITWKDEDIFSSSIVVRNYEIKDNALFLYGVTEERYNETQTVSAMVVPFSSMRYFTYEQRKV